jgi:serine/threonine protein kinase
VTHARALPRSVLALREVRFEILRRIGGGTLGGVYVARAVNGDFARTVVVKRLAVGDDSEGARDLREEARVLGRVRHGNVVALLAVGEHPGEGPFLVLEHVEGTDLRALVDWHRSGGARLPDAVAVHIACAVLRGLGAVERAIPGLVHRDVTPHNVLVSCDGEVKLGDFGIALARDRSSWTRPHFVKGKLGYMSPEQIRGWELDPRSDLFSVGVVLYELLSGERPWGPVRGIGELRAVIERPPTPVASRRSDLAPLLAAAVDRLVAPDRALRFAAAERALHALAPFGAGELGSACLAPYVRALKR